MRAAASDMSGDARRAAARGRIGAERSVIDASVARGIAYAEHLQARDRLGELVIEHVARVASAVPPEGDDGRVAS
jgi:hypothetical protein